MAFSGSNDFNQSTLEIIKDALILIGGIEDEEVPSAAQQVYGRRALNRMVKAWSAKGLKAWCWNEVSIVTVADQDSYEFGPTAPLLVTNHAIEVANVRKVVTGWDETPIRSLSRAEYMNLPKQSTGQPTAVYHQRRIDNGDLFVWPTPDDIYTIKFSAKQYIEDFDVASNEAYFPVEWLEAIVYNLAVRLCPKYEVRGEDLKILVSMAAGFLRDAEDSDMPEGSLFLSPEEFG